MQVLIPCIICCWVFQHQKFKNSPLTSMWFVSKVNKEMINFFHILSEDSFNFHKHLAKYSDSQYHAVYHKNEYYLIFEKNLNHSQSKRALTVPCIKWLLFWGMNRTMSVIWFHGSTLLWFCITMGTASLNSAKFKVAIWLASKANTHSMWMLHVSMVGIYWSHNM